jgi:zinc protease
MITDGLQQITLDNGLCLLAREVHSAPVLSFWLWYRVGSRNERPGLTGLSHWVEHMLFKGTPAYPGGQIDHLVQRTGGNFNAMTWLDWTTYHATLPADHLDLAIGIEADRMSNALFDAAETESERTVIISEREGNENRPTYQLFEQVQAHSFVAHPYRHMVIGWKEDLRAITRDQLFAHYRSFYTPNNAILAVVGDFETADLHERVAAAFGQIPPGPAPAALAITEPIPCGERRLHLSGPAGAAYLNLSFVVPGARHPDFFPLVVLDAVLGGAKGLPPFGGAPLGRSARLYRSLVNTGLAVSASSSMSATLDPYLFTVTATAHPQHTLAEVEAAALATIEQLQTTALPEAELRKAISGATAQFVYGSETVTNQALWLGFSQVVASVAWLAGFLGALAGVSAADVQRVAQTYFTADNRVVGWYRPADKAQ